MKKKLLRKTASQQEGKTAVDTHPVRDEQSLMIPISSIVIRQNPRSDLGDLTELKSSIDDRGLLTPLLVVKTAAGFELLGGHRRLVCARELGMTDVPCRLLDTDEPEVIKLIDNIIREDLSPEDECLAIKRLLPAFSGNKSALARSLSKSPAYVTRAIKVADMVEKGLCAGAKLTKTALMELADAPDPGALLAAAADGKKNSIRQARSETSGKGGTRLPSGPIAGDRAVDRAVYFRERRGGAAFTLRIAYDAEKTAPETKADIVRRLEEILRRIR